MKKIIAINIIILILILGVGEFLSFRYLVNRLVVQEQKYIKTKYRDYIAPPAAFKEPVSGKEYRKPSILLLGCSYTHGQGFSDDKNISERLIKDTGHYVYNFGQSGYGSIFALTQLLSEEEEPLISKDYKPEIIIYIYMFHHPSRWDQWNFYNVLRKNNLMPFQKYNFLYNSYIYQFFKNVETDKYFINDKDLQKRMSLFYEVMANIKKQTDKLYPNSRFIFLIYSDVNYDLCDSLMNAGTNEEQIAELFKIMYSKEFRQKLKDMGMEVVSTEDLIGRKMDRKSDRIPDDISRPHPSETAWDEILPKLEKYIFPQGS